MTGDEARVSGATERALEIEQPSIVAGSGLAVEHTRVSARIPAQCGHFFILH